MAKKRGDGGNAKNQARIERMMRASVKLDFTNGIETFKNNLDPGELAKAVATGKVSKVRKVIPWGKAADALAPVADRLQDAALKSGAASMQVIPTPKKEFLKLTLENPRVRRALEQGPKKYGEVAQNRLLTAVKEGGEQAIKEAVQRAYAKGISPAKAASEIRDSIGLNPRQATALANFRKGMEGARNPLPQKQIDKEAQSYADRMLDMRASMIAQTEIRFAQNEAQLLVWRAADENDLLPKGVKRQWVVDGKPCEEICQPMGRTPPIGLNEQWTLPKAADYRKVDNPTESHPHCMCIATLVFPD